MAGKVSAGLLLYRRRAGGVEVLLAHPGGPFWKRKDAGAWTIPKGQIEGEEAAFDRARQEFREELGAEPPEGEYLELGSVTQKSGKIIHAWACEGDFTGPVVSNTFPVEWPPRSGRTVQFPEVDRAEWFPPAEARLKLNPAQAEFVDTLLNKIGPKES